MTDLRNQYRRKHKMANIEAKEVSRELKNGGIGFFSRKSYDTVPRDTAQDDRITLEAKGLLMYLNSHKETDNFDLKKTYLYNGKFIDCGRRKIDRIWDELVDNGYMLQFRKRVGKTYSYYYLHSIEGFTVEDVLEIIPRFNNVGYMLYHKDMLQDLKNKKIQSLSELNPLDYVNLKSKMDWTVQNVHSKEAHQINVSSTVQNAQSNKPQSDNTFWDVQNVHSKEERNINDFWTVRFGLCILDCPKCTHSYKNLILNMDEEEEYIKQPHEIHFKILEEIFKQPEGEKLKVISQLLFESGFQLKNIVDIIMHISHSPELLDIKLIQEQIEWMAAKNESSTIADLTLYFVNGLEKRAANKTVKPTGDISEQFYSRLGLSSPAERAGNKQVPLINYLDDVGRV